MPSQENAANAWRFRPMVQQDILTCIKIHRKFGNLEDKGTVSSVLSLNAAFFWVAELVATGEVIGVCGANRLAGSPGTALVGFFAVEPEYQRRGIGTELWRRTTEKLLLESNLGVVSESHLVEKYAKMGFKFVEPDRMLFYQCKPSEQCGRRLAQLMNVDALEPGCRLIKVDQSSNQKLLRALTNYGQTTEADSSTELLHHFLTSPDAPLTLALVKKDKQEDDNLKVLGFGCVRRDTFSGGIIGPLQASSREYCEVILRNLMENFKIVSSSGEFSTKLMRNNKEAKELVERLGFRQTYDCPRLFTCFAPDLSRISRVYFNHSPSFTLF